MKVLIVLFACFVATEAAGDLICIIGGDIACKINCIASGKLHGGKCSEDKNECTCITAADDKRVTPQEKSGLLCILGGNLACEINCLTSVGHFQGHCDENNDCKCEAKPAPQTKTELICLLGGNLACEINCLTSQGHFLGHCDENNDCKCAGKPEPESRRDLACTLSDDSVCKAFCHWTTGKETGHCDEEKNCIKIILLFF